MAVNRRASSADPRRGALRRVGVFTVAAALACVGAFAHAQRPTSRSDVTSAADVLKGITLELDTLEEHTDQYIGISIQVTGYVDDVLGPHLFRIEDAEGDGDLLVAVPAPGLAAVRRGELLTLGGVLATFAAPQFERSLRWLRISPDEELEMSFGPVLVVTDSVPRGKLAVDPSALGDADESWVGRTVTLSGARVAALESGGFWLDIGDHAALVFAAGPVAVSAGQRVTGTGVLLQLPERVAQRVGTRARLNVNRRIYIYALEVSVDTR